MHLLLIYVLFIALIRLGCSLHSSFRKMFHNICLGARSKALSGSVNATYSFLFYFFLIIFRVNIRLIFLVGIHAGIHLTYCQLFPLISSIISYHKVFSVCNSCNPFLSPLFFIWNIIALCQSSGVFPSFQHF